MKINGAQGIAGFSQGQGKSPSFRVVSNISTCGRVHPKFSKMMTNAISRHALDGEGVLLPENSPRMETVLCKMIKEKF